MSATDEKYFERSNQHHKERIWEMFEAEIIEIFLVSKLYFYYRSLQKQMNTVGAEYFSDHDLLDVRGVVVEMFFFRTG
jgi:hypothetical protein